MKYSGKRYSLDQCALYAIKSPAQLAQILRTPVGAIKRLAAASDNYIRFENHGRQIQDPKPLLKKTQKRIATLLARVETPAYLHSAVKGRSYITNANVHHELSGTVKLDVKKFYTAARAQNVYHFFLDRLQCAPHVAGLLTSLLTVDGHLPTGGNASPILSFWAYRAMFDEIADLSDQEGAAFSTYVDDMTITGEDVGRSVGFEARQIVASYRLKSHKARRFRPGQTKIVTGVAMTRSGPQVPHRRQKLIEEGYASLAAARSGHERMKVLNNLISRVFEAAQVDSAVWKPKALELVRFRRLLQQRLRHPARQIRLDLPLLAA